MMKAERQKMWDAIEKLRVRAGWLLHLACSGGSARAVPGLRG